MAGGSVAVFSLEMSRHEVGMRMLCSAARVPWDRIRSKRVGPDDWVRVVQAAERLHDAPLSIVDSGNVNIVDVRAKARRMRSSKTGLSLIIVDYLQLMTSAAVRRPDNRQQEVAEISRSLKLLAKELGIPVLALSQLNRNPETRADKRPQLSDLRESGSLEQDSDVVAFIHRDDADPEKKKEAELILAKHRNGPTGSIKLMLRAVAHAVPQRRPRRRPGVTEPASPGVLRRRARTVLNRLRKRYGELVPPRRSDPLEELILTVLSQHTSDVNAERAFEALRAAFPAVGGRGPRADPGGGGRDPLGRSRGHEGAAHPGDPARGGGTARRLRPRRTWRSSPTRRRGRSSCRSPGSARRPRRSCCPSRWDATRCRSTPTCIA